MKKIKLLFLVFILFAGYFSMNALAQEAEIPTMYLVFEESVSPANMSTFFEVQSNALEQMKKHDADFTFWTYRTENSSFYWVMPLMNFASLDQFYEKSMKLQQMMKEDGYDADKEFRELSTMQSTIILWSKELSYHPDGTMGQSKEKPYCEWSFCYMKSGHEKEASDAVKKYIDFYDNSDIYYEWDIYQVILGQDTPCWILMVRAEDEIALRKLEKEISANHKEDMRKLWQNFAQHVRKIENKRGWFMPAWSMNLPE